MFKPLRATSAAFLVLCVLWPLSAVRADQRLLPLLVDLDGWQGEKPVSMDFSTTAIRDYRRGSAQLRASVIIGQVVEAMLVPAGINIKTSENHVITDTMRGMTVMNNFNTKHKFGTLTVALSKNAMFALDYKGVSEKEVLQLAEKFDWKALQAAAAAQ